MEQTSLLATEVKPEKKGPRARFTEDDADWVITADGHYKPLRVGEITPKARVRFVDHPDGRARAGTVLGLVPGIGYPLSVMVVVQIDITRKLAQRYPRAVGAIRHYRPEQLVVIRT